jgi:putative pyruvate formate lyase activating enzyme
MKYEDEPTARELSGIGNYPQANKAAVKEMHRQTGDLYVDEEGIAQRGLLIRHLVLPDSLAGTRMIMRFISEEISRDSYVNVMAQYRPCYRALQIPSLGRRITSAEFDEALASAREAGLTRLDKARLTQPLPTLSD